MEIVTALASMKAGIELATVALEARDDRKVREAVSEISRKLADVNIWAVGISDRLLKQQAELSEAVAKLAAAEKRLGEREKYHLRAVANGVFAYAYEPLGDDPTPAHYKCQICFDRGESSILVGGDDPVYLVCKIDPAHRLKVRAGARRPLVHRMAGGYLD